MVRQANGRLGAIDMLAARPAGAELVDAIIVRFQFDFDIVRFGQHGHGGGRCVDASFGFRFRHALHAVSAAFVLQFAENAFAGDAR